MDSAIFSILMVVVAMNAYAWWIIDQGSKKKDNALRGMHSDLLGVQEYVKNLNDERARDLNAMQEVFEFLNENKPFGANDIGLGNCRNILMHAIQNNTHNRGK